MQLNSPPLVFYGQKGTIVPPCKLENSGSVRINTIKKAEKDNSLIVRLTEEKGLFAKAVLKIEQDAQICECDMLEWNDGKVLSSGKSIQLEFTPFEIKTLRIRFCSHKS